MHKTKDIVKCVSAGENVPPLSGERCPPGAGEVVDEAQISSDESCVAG